MRKAENLVSMFQHALFRYYRRMENKNQPNEEVQAGAEKIRKELDDQLRQLAEPQ